MLMHLAHRFVEDHLSYYQQAAEYDAISRGFEQHQGEHYQLLRDWQSLPAYKAERLQFAPSPLQQMPDPDVSLERMSFTRFKCSARDSAVLHLAMIIERTNIQILMTKIMRWYFMHYWDSKFLYQLESDEQLTLSPTVLPQVEP
ncbi:hypothetical protein S7335_1145 [Synechococcus sp. PCC 7335]|nr:hypothetical protein S7335_1145 [Synechococcus sp. PCC 7335]